MTLQEWRDQIRDSYRHGVMPRPEDGTPEGCIWLAGARCVDCDRDLTAAEVSSDGKWLDWPMLCTVEVAREALRPPAAAAGCC